MNEEKLKDEAMRRYEQGEPPKNIYTSLGKGKTWFFKWLKRFKSGDPNWAKEHSRKPRTSPKKIDINMEQTVIATRNRVRCFLSSFPIFSTRLDALSKNFQLVASVIFEDRSIDRV